MLDLILYLNNISWNQSLFVLESVLFCLFLQRKKRGGRKRENLLLQKKPLKTWIRITMRGMLLNIFVFCHIHLCCSQIATVLSDILISSIFILLFIDYLSWDFTSDSDLVPTGFLLRSSQLIWNLILTPMVKCLWMKQRYELPWTDLDSIEVVN